MDVLVRVEAVGYQGHSDKIWGVFALNSLTPEQDCALLVKLKELLETIHDLPHLPLPHKEHLILYFEMTYQVLGKPRMLMSALEVGL